LEVVDAEDDAIRTSARERLRRPIATTERHVDARVTKNAILAREERCEAVDAAVPNLWMEDLKIIHSREDFLVIPRNVEEKDAAGVETIFQIFSVAHHATVRGK
jgi:hypothetical protein